MLSDINFICLAFHSQHSTGEMRCQPASSSRSGTAINSFCLKSTFGTATATTGSPDLAARTLAAVEGTCFASYFIETIQAVDGIETNLPAQVLAAI